MNRNIVLVAFKTFLYLLRHLLNAFKTVPVVLDSWTRGLVDSWTRGLVDRGTHEHGLVDSWTRGLVDYGYTYGLLDICMHIKNVPMLLKAFPWFWYSYEQKRRSRCF